MPIKFEDVTYTYNHNTLLEKTALKGVSLSIGAGEFVAVLGGSGSGKSTFLHLLGGLLEPTSGRMAVSDTGVGVVFQFPERQFFEDTVYKDLSFPLRKAGYSEKEVEERVRKALASVDIDLGNYRDRLPFELSSGEKRRIAIAAILVLDKGTIALDDPLAGLDHRGKKEILNELKRLNKEAGKTIIIATREAEFATRLCDRLIILEKGTLAWDGGPDEGGRKILRGPRIRSLVFKLKEKGVDLGDGVLDAEDTFQRIRKILGPM